VVVQDRIDVTTAKGAIRKKGMTGPKTNPKPRNPLAPKSQEITLLG
jgi:hypothetical protein